MTPKPTQSTLATYLAGTAGTAALLTAPQAGAAVVAVQYNSGPILNAANRSDGLYGVDDPGSAFGTLYPNIISHPSYGYFRLGHTSITSHGLYQDNSLLLYGLFVQGLPLFFDDGDVIGTGAHLGSGTVGQAVFYENYHTGTNLPSFSNQNIAFKSGSEHYGWAEVSWDLATQSLTIHQMYVESVANAPITVGDIGAVPEPSVSLLALAGIGGAVLRRKRVMSHG